MLLLCLLPGCADRALMPCQHDEGVDSDGPLQDLAFDGPVDFKHADLSQPPPPPFCREVIVVDESTLLSDFHPDTLTFHDIGMLKCPASGGATPFSMALGRDGQAWVLYSDGELFRVDVNTAFCQAIKFEPGQMGFTNFGMGFVSDAPGSEAETLFIAGTSTMELGSINLKSLTVKRIGPVGGIPELTGTGTAELWGFFPNPNRTFVAQIDKRTGATSNVIDTNALVGDPAAWAFAAWAGDFWIFLQRMGEDSTQVHRVTRDGKFKTVLGPTGRRIVGAGVSTCAPTM
jgi:hypothetical protein